MQWTIWARRGSNVLRRAIVELITRFIAQAQAQSLEPTFEGLAELKLDAKELLRMSGPAAFSDAVEAQARLEVSGNFRAERDLHHMTKPRKMGTTVYVRALLLG